MELHGALPRSKAPSLTAVAAAIGVSPNIGMGNIELNSIGIFLICMALGVVYLPGFTTGLLVGAVQALIGNTLVHIMEYVKPLNDNDSAYKHQILDNPLLVTLIGPTLEEVIFRGILLPMVLTAVAWLFPITTTTMLFGAGLSLAVGISVGLVALLFGIVHLNNKHEGVYRQAFVTSLAGITLGVLALEFGLAAAIGAHIMNNIIAFSLVAFKESGCSMGAITTFDNSFVEQPEELDSSASYELVRT